MNDKMINFLRYLYPTDEIRNFMCNDLYQELSNEIPYTKCFSSENIVNKNREDNLSFVKDKILGLVNNNQNYKQELSHLYKGKAMEDLLEDILIGYVFYIVNTNEKNRGEDIFKNKKSVCYSSGPTILDLL